MRKADTAKKQECLPLGAQTRRDGFSLVEVMVAVAIFLIVSLGIYRSYATISSAVEALRVQGAEVSLLNDQLELAYNLQYTDVGIVGGFPAGKIPHTQTIVREGRTFLVTTTVRNVDDPFDGTIGGLPSASTCRVSTAFTGANDTKPADYRCVEVEVMCTSCPNARPVEETAIVAAKDLEISNNGGALFVKTIDANGNPVGDASVHIENHKLNPDVTIDDVTTSGGSATGTLQLVDINPSVGGYQVWVSKQGYSSDKTYTSGNSQNPNPVKTDSTVVVGQVTQVTFVIDRVSTINVSSVNAFCSAVPNVDLLVEGAKLIGTTPDTLKFSTTTSTDGSGLKTMSNIEWDTYKFTVTDATDELSGSIPLTPLKIDPNVTQALKLITHARDPKSLLVTVQDSASLLPVTDADVVLTKGSFSQDLTTDRGALTQTDWSGGAWTGSGDLTKYFDSDGNIDIAGPAGELKLLKTGTDYAPSGWLISSTFDLGVASNFHNIAWQPQSQPLGVGMDPVRFQMAANNDNVTWNFVGPDGTAGSFFTLANTDISRFNGNRYIRYKTFLSTTDTQKTPDISDISFTYTTSCVPPGQVFFHGLAGGTYTLTVTHPSYTTWSDNAVQINAGSQSIQVLLSP